MPNYIVTVSRMKTEHAEVTVKAEDEDAAEQKARKIAEDRPAELDWELEDEELDIEEVIEE